LRFNILLDDIYSNTACRNQTETLRPEHLFPQRLAYDRKFFFNQPAARRLVRIDTFADFRIRLPLEKDVDMIFVMIPFLQRNVIFGRDVFKDFF
jgi:hypothetical protein